MSWGRPIGHHFALAASGGAHHAPRRLPAYGLFSRERSPLGGGCSSGRLGRQQNGPATAPPCRMSACGGVSSSVTAARRLSCRRRVSTEQRDSSGHPRLSDHLHRPTSAPPQQADDRLHRRTRTAAERPRPVAVPSSPMAAQAAQRRTVERRDQTPKPTLRRVSHTSSAPPANRFFFAGPHPLSFRSRKTPRGFGAVGSALPWHGRGQGFESPKLHRV